MKIKIAVVQPRSFFGEDEYLNVEKALLYVEEASVNGARLICMPEGYPGPNSGPIPHPKLTDEPIKIMQLKAKEKGVFIVVSSLDENPDFEGTFHITAKLIGPDGELLANYKRTHPNQPQLNAYLMGGRSHVAPGEELMVIPTVIGNIGLLVCSEICVPELARILMLKGADIIVAPGGGSHSKTRTSHSIGETWKCIARARAAENLVYVVINQNIFDESIPGRTCICSPERMLAETSEPGIIYAELDLDKLQFMRSHYMDNKILSTPPNDAEPLFWRPGQNHERRPELYGELVKEQVDAFDYKYYQRGFECWKEENEKIKKMPRPIIR